MDAIIQYNKPPAMSITLWHHADAIIIHPWLHPISSQLILVLHSSKILYHGSNIIYWTNPRVLFVQQLSPLSQWCCWSTTTSSSTSASFPALWEVPPPHQHHHLALSFLDSMWDSLESVGMRGNSSLPYWCPWFGCGATISWSSWPCPWLLSHLDKWFASPSFSRSSTLTW